MRLTYTHATVVSIGAASVAGCALLVPLDDLGASGDAAIDAAQDASADVAKCDPTAPFEDVRPLPELESSSVDNHATLSPDELQIWFSSARYSDAGTRDIFTATRTKRTASFNPPKVVPELSTAFDDAQPSITPDLKTIFYAQADSTGQAKTFVAQRSSPTATFGTPAALSSNVNAAPIDWMPVITSDSTTLFFTRGIVGNSDTNIYSWPYSSPSSSQVAVTELNTTGLDQRIAISVDALWIYWASDRKDLGTSGLVDIFVAHRAAVTDAFVTLADVPTVSSSGNESPDWLSPDFCRLYLHSDKGGNDDLYVAERTPR